MIEKLKKLCEQNNYRISYSRDVPQLILIGEKHGTLEQINFQEEVIALLRPKIVVHELFRKTDKYIKIEDIKQNWFHYTITKFVNMKTKYGFELREGDFGRDEKKEQRLELDQVMGHIKDGCPFKNDDLGNNVMSAYL